MAQYHLSLKELTWTIPWAIIMRMSIDAPGYKTNKVDELEKDKPTQPKLKMTPDNQAEIIALMSTNI